MATSVFLLYGKFEQYYNSMGIFYLLEIFAEV